MKTFVHDIRVLQALKPDTPVCVMDSSGGGALVVGTVTAFDLIYGIHRMSAYSFAELRAPGAMRQFWGDSISIEIEPFPEGIMAFVSATGTAAYGLVDSAERP
jgi:hypothetical protein